MQLAIAISNLLENAIHACEKFPETERFIEVTAKYKQQLLLEISNSCMEKAKLDEDGYPVASEDGHVIGTITFQTWNPADYGPDSPIYKIIAAFEKENPDIKVKYVFTESNAYQEHMRVELINGNGPDVYGISAGSRFDGPWGRS